MSEFEEFEILIDEETLERLKEAAETLGVSVEELAREAFQRGMKWYAEQN